MSEERHETASLITGVYYERKQHAGPYQHEVVGATALVRAVETPEEALAALREWVGDQLGESQRAMELARSCQSLEEERQTLEGAVETMRARYEKARQFITRLGLSAPLGWDDRNELPF